MKALLVGLNARHSHSCLALFYLRNEIESAGKEAGILEFHISQPRLEIIQAIVLSAPEALLISTYIWNSQLVKSILPDLARLLPGIPLILGGPEAGYRAGAWLEEFPFLECVVGGSGEGAVRFLAQRGFRSEAEKFLRLPSPPFAEIPFPYREADLDRFSRRYVYYESSRGCPFSCAYCLSSRADQGLEEKSAARAREELARIIAHEPRWPEPPIVKFVDRSFNADPGRAREIWDYLAGAATRATFHFEIHPALLREEDFAFLGSLPRGRFQFEIGVQSVNQRTLDAVGRRMDWNEVGPKIGRLAGLGNIHIHVDLIAGLPGEDLEDCARSLDEVLSQRPHHLQLGFLKSLPGTAIDEEGPSRSQIAMKDPPYQVLANDRLSVADFRLLRRVESLLDAVWNANALEAELDELSRAFGGYFAAFRRLSEKAELEGYDLSTRNPEKVRAFLRSAAEDA